MYYVYCPQCGKRFNYDESYCDECGSPLDKILLGGIWYDVDDLIASNPFN